MDLCGWLSVKQLIAYQSIVMIQKTIHTHRPLYLHSRLNLEFDYGTRQQSSGCIRLDQTYRYKGDLPKNSFRVRGTISYNSIPAEIRSSLTMATFKSRLKKWIRTNISLE